MVTLPSTYSRFYSFKLSCFECQQHKFTEIFLSTTSGCSRWPSTDTSPSGACQLDCESAPLGFRSDCELGVVGFDEVKDEECCSPSGCMKCFNFTGEFLIKNSWICGSRAIDRKKHGLEAHHAHRLQYMSKHFSHVEGSAAFWNARQSLFGKITLTKNKVSWSIS